MPWRDPMDEKKRFIEDYRTGEHAVAALARFYQISRDTAHTLIRRWEEDGPRGLENRSSAPRRHPNQTPDHIVDGILDLRRERGTWGPKKLQAWLRDQRPTEKWPAPSTIGAILKARGLVCAVRKRHRTPPGPMPWRDGQAPNDVWGVDFKGWFRTQDGVRVDPLTASDLASRFLLKCQITKSQSVDEVIPIFEAAFREYGLPGAIRSDNGCPFASIGLGGLTKLSAWWIRLGIGIQRIVPGHPEQNGCHERMHKTLKRETAKPPKSNPRQQQIAFDRFRQDFNEQRPHQALGQIPPARVYSVSKRSYPIRLPEVEYSSAHVVRSVRNRGEIKWEGGRIFLSAALIGERVGLVQLTDEVWAIDFVGQRIGFLDSTKRVIMREFKAPGPEALPC